MSFCVGTLPFHFGLLEGARSVTFLICLRANLCYLQCVPLGFALGAVAAHALSPNGCSSLRCIPDGLSMTSRASRLGALFLVMLWQLVHLCGNLAVSSFLVAPALAFRLALGSFLCPYPGFLHRAPRVEDRCHANRTDIRCAFVRWETARVETGVFFFCGFGPLAPFRGFRLGRSRRSWTGTVQKKHAPAHEPTAPQKPYQPYARAVPTVPQKPYQPYPPTVPFFSIKHNQF